MEEKDYLANFFKKDPEYEVLELYTPPNTFFRPLSFERAQVCRYEAIDAIRKCEKALSKLEFSFVFPNGFRSFLPHTNYDSRITYKEKGIRKRGTPLELIRDSEISATDLVDRIVEVPKPKHNSDTVLLARAYTQSEDDLKCLIHADFSHILINAHLAYSDTGWSKRKEVENPYALLLVTLSANSFKRKLFSRQSWSGSSIPLYLMDITLCLPKKNLDGFLEEIDK